ncbi:metallophosphoesterase [Halobacteriales archaeon QS_1_67_19]|nr:MAG: metallophosphoesterase [Halobacteriales archaeon QS_1_67_19]
MGSAGSSACAVTDSVPESLATTRSEPTPLARLPHPRSETVTKLALVADPHVSADREGTWKVFHRTETRLRTALADADDRDVDGVVFAGDLTEDGRPRDFDLVADLLAELDAPVVAVPGNHDVPKSFKDHETPPVSAFESRFAPGSFPHRAEIGDADVLALNAATAPDGSLEDTHDGAIGNDQLAWLESTLPETTAPVVVTHHNLAGLGARIDVDGSLPHPPVEGAAELGSLVADHDALHVSGHVHLPAMTRYRGANGLICPALSSFPQAYALAEIGPTGTTVRLVPVADERGLAEAYELAQNHSNRSATVVDLVANQLADLPLIDER